MFFYSICNIVFHDIITARYENDLAIYLDIYRRNTMFDTKLEGFKIRFADRKDVPLILNFIKDLAEYEHMSEEVVATNELLEKFLFDQQKAEVIIGEYQQAPVAFALFFHNFSTFLGQPGIYLEDLFVLPEMRGKGFGTMMITFLAALAVERECGRLEWSCLDWNEPSIKFYKSMGAIPMEEWTTFRATGKALENMAFRFRK